MRRFTYRARADRDRSGGFPAVHHVRRIAKAREVELKVDPVVPEGNGRNTHSATARERTNQVGVGDDQDAVRPPLPAVGAGLFAFDLNRDGRIGEGENE